MGGFSESDLVVLTSTLNQDLSDYVEPDVELVVFPVNTAVTPTTQLTCLQLPIPYAPTRSGDYGATFNRKLYAFFVPGPTFTSWHFAYLPHRVTWG
jgi:hypothetical protein